MPTCNCVDRELTKEALARMKECGYSLHTVNFNEKRLYRENTLRYKVIDNVWFYVLSDTEEAKLTYADVIIATHKDE